MTEDVEVVPDDKIDRTGWMALTWSFSLSAGFTVRLSISLADSVLMLQLAAAEYRVPSRVCRPNIRRIRSLGAQLVVVVSSCIPSSIPSLNRRRRFTPSFSYIGQGIIMGFPTTASMNLVCCPTSPAVSR